MNPTSEHEVVIQVLREMVERVLIEASPVMATVASVSDQGAAVVRLDDEEAVRTATMPRNPALRLKANDRVLVVRTLANQMVIVCPVAMAATGTDAARIGTEQLVDGAVTTAKLGAAAVGTTQIANGAITAAKLASGALPDAPTFATLVGPGSITRRELATNAVGAGNIENGAVTDEKIAAVAGGKIQNGTITAAKLGFTLPDGTPPNGSVTTPKLAEKAVTTAKLDARAVTSEKLAEGAVTREKVATNTDGKPIFSVQNHGHGPGDITQLNWSLVGSVEFSQTQNGNRTNLSLEQVLNRLYKKVYGADSSVP